MPKCSCGVTACFGLKGQVASCCATHRLEGMINVVDVLCSDCDKRAMYNIPGKTGGILCIDHKTDGMVNVKGKRCTFVYDNKLPCYTTPIYNTDGELRGKFCIVHKEDGMVNVTGKRCERDGCKCIAQYNVDGEIKGKYCSTHKDEGMVDVKHKTCEMEGCRNQPSYKFETDTSCRFCATHRLEGMTNGKHVYCVFDGCNTFAGYNAAGSKTPLYCTTHKQENMVDLKHHLCFGVILTPTGEEIGCDKRPIFNNKGSTNGLYCVVHKKDGMIDVISPRCKSQFCESYSRKKYDYYCIHCFIHLFPEKSIARNYKTKEKSVVDFILSKFTGFTWIADKRIQDGCSRRRPDLLLDLGSHVLIVEVDENQHTDYDCSCENKRIMEISRDIGHRHLIFIRFNPDDYLDNKNNKITSCWIINNKCGILYVPKNKQSEWNNRLFVLQKQVQYWIENKPGKLIEIIQLFYNRMIPILP
jgi:hypothetical protein